MDEVKLIMDTFGVDTETATKMLAAGINVSAIKSNCADIIRKELHTDESLDDISSAISKAAKNL